MKLHNKAKCKECGDIIISERGGQFVTCKCGKSSIDTDRWDCMNIRLIGSAEQLFDSQTVIAWILMKQCVAVGASFYYLDKDKPLWYNEYSWTEKQQDSFIEALAKTFYNEKMLTELLTNTKRRRTKKYCLKLAQEWILNYGWKLKSNIELI